MKTILTLVALGAFFAVTSAGAGESAAAPTDLKLFLLIGQSNMAGRGVVEAADLTPHARVLVLNKAMAWVPAVDPLHWDKPTLIGVGLGSTLGRMVAEAQPGVTVGLIPAAFGGSSLDQWAPGSEHYTNAVTRAREAMKRGTLAGILWHQGEADSAPEKVATYAERFGKLIAQLRADLRAESVPVVVGELGYFREKEASVAINRVLTKLPDTVAKCAAVSAEGLTHKGDNLHFDSASFRELGRRYAKAWMGLAADRR